MAPDASGPKTIVERIVYVKAWSRTFRRLIAWLPDWITPNRVTVLRASLAVPVFWTLSTGRYWTALAVFCLAMALDAVDGAIAHVKDMHTTSGAFLDPLADKLILCAAVFAAWQALPGWILFFAGAGVLFAAAITLMRISALLQARLPDGPALSRAVAAKPAGKVKTIFDVLSASVIMIGLARRAPALVDAGGALLIFGSILAALIHFFPGRRRASVPDDRSR